MNGLRQEEDRKRKKEMGGLGGRRVVVKLNDCSVRNIIDDSGSVNY